MPTKTQKAPKARGTVKTKAIRRESREIVLNLDAGVGGDVCFSGDTIVALPSHEVGLQAIADYDKATEAAAVAGVGVSDDDNGVEPDEVDAMEEEEEEAGEEEEGDDELVDDGDEEEDLLPVVSL